jgi:hypothetical protein
MGGKSHEITPAVYYCLRFHHAGSVQYDTRIEAALSVLGRHIELSLA